MKIVIIGGGPSGVYFALSMMRENPGHQITLYEQKQAGDNPGWGLVLSDQTMDILYGHDRITADAIAQKLVHWDQIAVDYRGQSLAAKGHAFVGIGRKGLLQILYDRAEALGVKLVFGADIPDQAITKTFPDADLIVAADGLNSQVRNQTPAAFGYSRDQRPNKFIWLGTDQNFASGFRFIFEQTPAGWVWAHVYPFTAHSATFIVECGAETFVRLGFDRLDSAESIARCRQIFAAHLGGHALEAGANTRWLNFPQIHCACRVKDNIVLIGDAAHTVHFSVGSGTRMAIEDAIALAHHLNEKTDLSQALAAYQAERQLEALKLYNAAHNSMVWFESVDRYLDQMPLSFVYGLLTRSQRVSHENLRQRDPVWLEKVEQDFAEKATEKATEKITEKATEKITGKITENKSNPPPVSSPPPPMFTPYRLRDMRLKNRVGVAPTALYSAKEGLIGDFHFVHYGARAMGGAGLLYTEMTVVTADGRISPGCAGLYTDQHTKAWQRLVAYVHEQSDAKIVLQLGHAGRKGATHVGWEGYGRPLESGEWSLIAPSPLPWDEGSQIPHAMDEDDFARITTAFVDATRRAIEAGFDMIELHAGHGYLLSSFLTPLNNRRTDGYGGCLENRLRFPLAVFRAMRAVWPAEKPMSVRLSATDWAENQKETGLSPTESVAIARAFVAAGADIISVSSGQTAPLHQTKPGFGRMFQVPLSDRIRHEAQTPTITAGNIYEADHVNSILAAGRADLVLLARSFMMNPNWMLDQAAGLGYQGPGLAVPRPYQTAYDQLENRYRRAGKNTDGKEP